MYNRILTPSANLNVMIAAVQKAGRALVRDFGEIEQLQVSKKSLGDFVSSADQRSEKILKEELLKARPNIGFLLEESGFIPGEDPDFLWLVDPLDGTSNFLHGIPHFCVSVALKKQDEITAAVVYNPVSNEIYWAEKGSGAFMNNRRLRVSGRRNLQEALIAASTPFSRHGSSPFYLNVYKNLVEKVSGIRRSGSTCLDMAYVAAGRFDGSIEENIYPWDMAPGLILIKEAGGYISDFQGKKNPLHFLSKGEDTGSVITGNELLFPNLKAILDAQQTREKR